MDSEVLFHYDAYLGFETEDQAWAAQLARRLRSDGVQVLTAPSDVAVGLKDARHILLVPPASLSLEDIQTNGLVGHQHRWDRHHPGNRVLLPLMRRSGLLPDVLKHFPALDMRSFGALERVYPTLLRTLRPSNEPDPIYNDDDQRRLGTELEVAQTLLDRLVAGGAEGSSVSQVESRVLQLKRELRDADDLPEGYILSGRYRLLDPIGSGGFATVWRAWDRERLLPVAVKVLHPQHLRDRAKVARFFKGAEAMSTLAHEHIVSVFETELKDGGHHFFVMEMVAGSNLENEVLAGHMSLGDVLRVISQTGQALHHAHREGLVHCDVKPSNVLLTAGGDARLTDFDLVWSGDSTMNITTGALGTFIYSAPEQIQAGSEIEPRRDVYGLGMTALFALSGAALTPDVLFERDAFVTELRLPESVKEVLLRAVHLRPERRYGTVAAFVGSLIAAFEGQPR